jgi:uncharacterized protein
MTLAANPVREPTLEENTTMPVLPETFAPRPSKPSTPPDPSRAEACAAGARACRVVDCHGEMHRSRYNIFIPIKARRLLAYNAITGNLTLWDSMGIEVYNHVSSMPCTEGNKITAARLLKGGYLVRKGQDQYADLKKAYEKHRFNPKVMTLSIAPTMSCNFSCDYCFQGDRKARAVMKPEVQDALVAFVEKSISKLSHLHTAWYGGEPMLRWSTIYKLADRFIDLCNAHSVKYDATMVTNGYLLTQKKAERLYRRRVRSIQITLDGPPEQHNTRRPLKSGGPTFDTIVSNIRKIVGTIPIGISVRINVDTRNCDMAGMDRLFQTLVDNGLANNKSFRVYFAPVEAMTRECSNIAGRLLAREEYARKELELFKTAIRKGLAGYRYPPRFSGTCAAVRPNGYVVLPDGTLHKCWDTVSTAQSAIGTLFDMDKVAGNEIHQKWLNWSPFKIEACNQCQLLPVCAGACSYKMLYHEDTSGETAGLPCLSWKYNIKNYLLMFAISRKMITLDDVLPSDLQTGREQTARHCGPGAEGALP